MRLLGPARDSGDHRLAELEAGDSLAERIDVAGQFVAGRERVGGSRLVEAEAHHQVGEVDAGERGADAHLSGSR